MNKAAKTQIVFFSTECYPAAKTGGLGDVVGSLPKYLNKKNAEVTVVIPKYDMPWLNNQYYNKLYAGHFSMGAEPIDFSVEYVLDDPLDFKLVTIHIPGKFDRHGVYAGNDGHFFDDEVERYAAFCRASLDWLSKGSYKPEVIHCHDHHTGLIPFMVRYCPEFSDISNTPLVFTIHNERYQGTFSWDKHYLLPAYDTWKSGMLDWNEMINPLASAIKCCWRLTTVSPSYMKELQSNSFGLEWLFQNEKEKSMGILNGIDAEYWDPKKDQLISIPLKRSVTKFKSENKRVLLKDGPLNPEWPLVSFIGRFALEKGADLLPGLIDGVLRNGNKVNFLILGTGDKGMEYSISRLADHYPEQVIAHITYNEKLAHQIYAGSDFLIMPSRVEPCGLNQMFSLRYGTIPIVHNIGGLKDSVVDIDLDNGSGIKTNDLSRSSLIQAVERSIALYEDKSGIEEILKRIIKIDNSWENSAAIYMKMYKELINN